MEIWDIYDENGNLTGRTKERGGTFGQNEYHLAIELWIINSKGEILLQKRSKRCEVLPGIWALTTGRVRAGEDSRSGCIREAKEELSVELPPDILKMICRINRGDGLIWDIFQATMDLSPETLSLQCDEVAAVKWVDREEFLRLLKAGSLFYYPEIHEVLALALAH